MRLGRLLVLVALLSAALMLSACSTPVEGQRLPEVTVVEFGTDQPVAVDSLKGPMVLNFWASWCTPCREELPVLQAFHEKYGDQVAVVGVDYQDPRAENARELVVDSGVTYRLLADDDGELNGADPLPNIQGLPLTVFVDENGRVSFLEYGEVETVDELVAMVGEHLDVDL